MIKRGRFIGKIKVIRFIEGKLLVCYLLGNFEDIIILWCLLLIFDMIGWVLFGFIGEVLMIRGFYFIFVYLVLFFKLFFYVIVIDIVNMYVNGEIVNEIVLRKKVL